MRRRAHIALSVACAAAGLVAASPLAASDLRLIVHPTRAELLTVPEVRAIYLKQKLFWDDGQSIVPINREAGSSAREFFSTRVFGQDSLRLAGYWNQRYFEGGEFPPATLASDEAVVRFVAGNANAIGYVSADTVDDSVAVAVVLQEREGRVAGPPPAPGVDH